MKNVLWLEVNQTRLCFVYDHLSGNIDVKESSIQGKTIKSFNNKTPLEEVKSFLESLQNSTANVNLKIKQLI